MATYVKCGLHLRVECMKGTLRSFAALRMTALRPMALVICFAGGTRMSGAGSGAGVAGAS